MNFKGHACAAGGCLATVTFEPQMRPDPHKPTSSSSPQRALEASFSWHSRLLARLAERPIWWKLMAGQRKGGRVQGGRVESGEDLVQNAQSTRVKCPVAITWAPKPAGRGATVRAQVCPVGRLHVPHAGGIRRRAAPRRTPPPPGIGDGSCTGLARRRGALAAFPAPGSLQPAEGRGPLKPGPECDLPPQTHDCPLSC